MSDIVKKQINDFTLDNNPQGDSSLIIQTATGTTKRTTKTALLNDVNASFVGIQSQIDNITSPDLSEYAETTTVTAISGNLQGQIDNLDKYIFSSIPCISGQQYYEITYGETIPNPFPNVSLVVPSISEAFLLTNIYNVSNTSFFVALSSPPPVDGYKINWSVNR